MKNVPPIVLALAIAFSGCGATPRDPRPDVVLVVIDTLRPDHLGFLGYEHATAPFLAEIAREAAVFTRAQSSSSWTAPATASLLTGLYPIHHGVITGLRAHQRDVRRAGGEPGRSLPLHRLPDEVSTLAERFAAGGYRTHAVASNLNLGPELGLLRGFERTKVRHSAPAPALRRSVQAWEGELRDGPGPHLLYLHYFDPHKPYYERAPWYRPAGDERGDVVAAYDSEIAYFDEDFAKLYQRMGWADGALLVVVSDHGEEFWERGRLGHEFSLHRELTDVVMLFRGPGIAPGRIATPVSLVDVLPTLAELAGLPAAPGDGRSLVPLLRASASPPAELAERPLFAHRADVGHERTQHLWAVVRGGWKLIEGAGGATLYDLGSDPDELRDVAAAHPEIRAQLARDLAAHRAAGFRGHEAITVELDAEQRATLESLGYLED